MNELGNIALQLAFVFAAASVAVGLLGIRRRDPGLIAAAERAVALVLWLATIAVLALVVLLLRNDFHNRYVWSVSSDGLPAVYRLSALWAGQAGSLLFWSWIFAVLAFAVARSQRGRHPALMPWVNAIIMANVFFFLWVNVFDANPFERYFQIFAGGAREPFTPERGAGLNPQLHHPLMIIHPGVLYIGYIGFVVPFAFALASLLAGDSTGRWLRITRRWTLFAWLSLGVGIVLGARWAYTELGWGGYWAWDPVENASLMPWLCATAFLHAALLQERQGMLKRWNLVLATLTYLLCLFGAFLTRSGLISSVHAYAKSDVGKHFSIFMIVIVSLTVALLVWRLSTLRGGRPLGSFFSRDGLLFWNNFFLLIGCLIVFIGTMLPAFTELIVRQKREVDPGFFNWSTPPVVFFLLFLLGMLPASIWRQAPRGNVLGRLLVPGIAALAVVALLPLAGLVRHPYLLPALGAAAFALVGVGKDLLSDVADRARNRGISFSRAAFDLFRALPRRSGAHVAHLGVALMIVGFAGAALNRQTGGSVRVGEHLDLGSLRFTLQNVREQRGNLFTSAVTTVAVSSGGKQVALLEPEARFYTAQEKRTSEVALHSNLLRDVYVVFSGYDDREGRVAHLEIYVRPLVNWVWIGGIVALVGSLFCFGPFERQNAFVPAAATRSIA